LASQPLAQAISFAGHALRRLQHETAFPGESLKTLAALNDGHAQLHFQLLNRRRERGLRNVAGGRRACEVALFGERHQIFQFSAQHTFSATSTIRYASEAAEIDSLNPSHRRDRSSRDSIGRRYK